MVFNDELLFEKEVITHLTEYGWNKNILKNKTEKQLLDNWSDILYNNNKTIDRLDKYPLTEGEKAQLIEQINKLKSPLMLNKFINGKTISITRDNPNDLNHFGKEVSLDIYDREQIAGGKSVYQIAEQPIFTAKNAMLNSRRGDLILLINGIPVIHIELKKSGIPVSQAINQIKKYTHEGVFTGLFSLIQVFVAMTPEQTKYFANPGSDNFNDKFQFEWADFNNEPYKDWNKNIEHLLSIPMAHKLIGFYTVPDTGDGILKVMRSYQYYAVEAINHRVDRAQWTSNDKLGGYIFHTTGSGKTMTSFKTAQLLSAKSNIDKVIFLMDRIELGTQSAIEYRNFADDRETVQETESTSVLITKLKSSYSQDSLIVTSIQKMSNIQLDEGVNKRDIEIIGSKRIVFIIDECHRSTFGDMLADIKETFPTALYFGFTGTPIFDENQKKMNTTNTIFGNELHRYSISDGIRDGNVLAFDPYIVETFSKGEIRQAVALQQTKAKNVVEALSNPNKKEIYQKYMNDVPMAGYTDDLNNYHKGIEDYVDVAQYEFDETKPIEKQHQYQVVLDILKYWQTTSVLSKFHAIFATSSILEACQYYHLFKEMMGKNGLPVLKITGIFDATVGNNSEAIPKEEALKEILDDYNKNYQETYSIPKYAQFKKDVQLRLAHKEKYTGISKTQDQQLDLLIVVDQMLTGYDSKWVNTLYLDKMLRYEAIIQAFSRTNRIFGKDKPYGIVKYYRYPYTTKRNIEKAFELYSGNKPFGIFVDKLEANIKLINQKYIEIDALFKQTGIMNFERNPYSKEERAKFAQLFSMLSKIVEAARIQGFSWKKNKYVFEHDSRDTFVDLIFDENTFLILALRYKELFAQGPGPGTDDGSSFDIDSTAIEIDTGKIDLDYLNSKFKKYVKVFQENGKDGYLVQEVLKDLHKSFASLTQEEQKTADIILFDIQDGKLIVENGKTFRDYINEYQIKSKNDQIRIFATKIGFDEKILRNLMALRPTEANLNDFGRFDALRATLKVDVSKAYFEAVEGKRIPNPRVIIKAEVLARKFIVDGGFDL